MMAAHDTAPAVRQRPARRPTVTAIARRLRSIETRADRLTDERFAVEFEGGPLDVECAELRHRLAATPARDLGDLAAKAAVLADALRRELGIAGELAEALVNDLRRMAAMVAND